MFCRRICAGSVIAPAPTAQMLGTNPCPLACQLKHPLPTNTEDLGGLARGEQAAGRLVDVVAHLAGLLGTCCLGPLALLELRPVT
jgi:hypothetical protein